MASHSERTPSPNPPAVNDLTSTPEARPQVNAEATTRTPAVLKANGTKAYSTTQPTASSNQEIMSDETKGYWIGPCPVSEFGDSFLSTESQLTRPDIPKTFFADKDIKKEEDLYSAFDEFVNEKGACPEYELRDTSRHHDPNSRPGSRVKPDSNLYEKGVVKPGYVNHMDKASLVVEFKYGKDLDILIMDSHSDRDAAAPFEATAEKRLKARGQLVTYLVEMAARQRRTHIFVVFVFHPYARLIRWDRAGIVVSEKFEYVEDCSVLSDFFFRYSQLTKEAQGYDRTAKLASKDETTHAHNYLADWAPVKVEREVYKIQVPFKSPDGTTTMRSFLVWGALAEAASPLGRGTKGWPALEVKKGKPIDTVPVFLKEQWRGKDVTPEVETLKLLNDKGVEFVPTLVCGGDISGDFQTTVTHEYADKSWRMVSNDPKLVKKIETRIHVRLVTKEVGRPLENFASSREMMKVIYDAFKGHQQAYNLCNLLHRDVSGGNILILDNGDGLLNDWDLAIRLDDSGPPRTGERTGTWPFMSYSLLSDQDKLHTVRDDLESFFWVVLFYSLHYVPHALSYQKKLDDKIYQVFHQYAKEDGIAYGAGGKEKLLNGSILEFRQKSPYIKEPFEFAHCLPLTNYLRNARNLLVDWETETQHAFRSPPDAQQTAMWYADPLFKMHDDAKHLFEDVLSEEIIWPTNDQAILQLATSKPAGFKISNKRKAVEAQPGSSKKLKKSAN
ncbi:hypothetical protein ONZ45_g14177 [Pleurotus djamor]|nr:hypothetical protein ONZ45_g14177 [Pleurotus djamor]